MKPTKATPRCEREENGHDAEGMWWRPRKREEGSRLRGEPPTETEEGTQHEEDVSIGYWGKKLKNPLGEMLAVMDRSRINSEGGREP